MQVSSASTAIGLPALAPRRVAGRCPVLRSTCCPRPRQAVKTSASEQEPQSRDGVDFIASKDLVEDLMDPNAFGTRGEGWFVAQLVTFGVIALPPSGLTGAIDSLALLAFLAGCAGVAASALGLGTSLSPLPEPRKNHALVTDGIYGYARHPMYGSVLLIAFGLAIFTHSETRLLAAGVLWWILENKATLEEAALAKRYPEYDQYQTKVKKFFPYVY